MALPDPVPGYFADADLARRCAGGDRSAQRELFDKQRAGVHRTLYRVLGSNRQIEDLVQDTFVAVFNSIGSFRGESSLRTWIDTIAVRVSYRHLSRRELRPQHLQAVVDLPAGTPDPEREAAAREAVRRLYGLLDRIEAKHRIAYTLHVLDGRPIKEVARATRTTALAVKNRVWRARRKLSELALRDPLLTELISKHEAAP